MLLMANHVKAANAIYKNTGFAVENKPEGRIARSLLWISSCHLIKDDNSVTIKTEKN